MLCFVTVPNITYSYCYSVLHASVLFSPFFPPPILSMLIAVTSRATSHALCLSPTSKPFFPPLQVFFSDIVRNGRKDVRPPWLKSHRPWLRTAPDPADRLRVTTCVLYHVPLPNPPLLPLRLYSVAADATGVKDFRSHERVPACFRASCSIAGTCCCNLTMMYIHAPQGILHIPCPYSCFIL